MALTPEEKQALLDASKKPRRVIVDGTSTERNIKDQLDVLDWLNQQENGCKKQPFKLQAFRTGGAVREY